MKKYITSVVLLLAVTGCSGAVEEPAAPANNTVVPVTSEEKRVQEVEEPVATTEENKLATDENLEFNDDVTQFEAWIANMATWQSYKATLDNYDTYFDKESNIDREYHEQIEYVSVPYQLFQSTHSIGFQNSHMDRYIVENAETGVLEGVERFSFEEWQTLEDVEYYAKNIAPARAEMLQAMIDFSEERLLSEDGLTLTLNVLPEKSKEAFSKLSMAINFVVTEAELTEDIQGQLAMDESDVDMVSAVIYSDGSEITGYDINVHVNVVDSQQYDQYTFAERFSDMDTLEYTTTPEDL